MAAFQNPQELFERTYLTKSLLCRASEVMRRLSGEKTETSSFASHNLCLHADVLIKPNGAKPWRTDEQTDYWGLPMLNSLKTGPRETDWIAVSYVKLTS